MARTKRETEKGVTGKKNKAESVGGIEKAVLEKKKRRSDGVAQERGPFPNVDQRGGVFFFSDFFFGFFFLGLSRGRGGGSRGVFGAGALERALRV